MTLDEKLRLLSGGSLSDEESEAELAGISVVKETGEVLEEEPELVVDFNLGDLSIDSYLQEEGIKPEKKKKSSSKRQSLDLFSPKKRLFDDFFGEDEEKPSLGKYQTGNSDLDDATRRSRQLLSASELMSADEFDSFLDDEEAFSAEEDAELRGHLVSMGRKYARDNAASAETSEINKAYADSEKRLKDLFTEVNIDKEGIQKDIERMRVPGRGGKMLSDMIEARNTMHNTQLSIIKEMNAVKKAKFELKAKEQARKDAEAQGGNDISANTLQSIFSSARSSLVGSMGGYTRVSGAEDDDDHSVYVESEDSDEDIQRKYFSHQDSSSDGDKFLEYEGRGVEYVLIVDKDDQPQQILAEDKDGNLIPDYPIPQNMDQLTFDIDHISHHATDTLHRNYKVRVEE